LCRCRRGEIQLLKVNDVPIPMVAHRHGEGGEHKNNGLCIYEDAAHV